MISIREGGFSKIEGLNFWKLSIKVIIITILLFMFLSPQLIYPLKEVSLSCSILMMISLATERYIALYRPFSR